MAGIRKRSQSHNSDLDSSETKPQPLIQILLIGRTGNGKSTLGNRILRRSSPFFEVSTGIISATTSTKLGEGLHKSQHGSYRIEVVDFPDICEIDDGDQKKEAETCRTLTFPYPTAVCLVVRADIRFTPEEYANYQDTKTLLGSDVLNHNLIVVFTMADRLPAQQRDNFEQQLQKANEDLQQVMRDASNRYVLLGNSDLHRDSCHSSRDKQLVTGDLTDVPEKTKNLQLQALFQLMDTVVGLYIRQQASSTSSSERNVRALLLGPKRSGKSATGNTILYPDPRFEENAVTSYESCESASTTTRLFRLEIVDTTTPDVSLVQEEKHCEVYESEVRKWIYTFVGVFDVFLYVVSACDCSEAKEALENFSERDTNVLRALEKVLQSEAEIHKRLILIFSKTDLLKNEGKTLDQQLQRASPVLQSLIKKASNRYVQLDNKTRNDQELRLQQNRLFRLVDQVVGSNKGKISGLKLSVPELVVSDRGKNRPEKENAGRGPEKENADRSLFYRMPGFRAMNRQGQLHLDKTKGRRRSSSVEAISATFFSSESTAAQKSYPLLPTEAENWQEPKKIQQPTLTTNSPNQKSAGAQNQPVIPDPRQQNDEETARDRPPVAYKKKGGGSQTRHPNRSKVYTRPRTQQSEDRQRVSSNQPINVQGSRQGNPGDTRPKERNMTSACIVS